MHLKYHLKDSFKEEAGLNKAKIISAILFFTVVFAGCSGKQAATDSIYDKIHEAFYDINSYNAKCDVTTFTPLSKNTYNCSVSYNKNDNSYTVNSDDMKIFLTNEKCVISKGENTIESPSVNEDMYIFVNTFFKSYYESEDTSLSVNADDSSGTVLLECTVINPTKYASAMKLWISKKTVTPKKMQVLDKEGTVNTEIIFTDFSFT